MTAPTTTHHPYDHARRYPDGEGSIPVDWSDDHVTDAELDAGIQAAEHWQANAERANRRSDARAYRQIVGELWAEYRRRLGWQAANDGAGPRMWFVYRETATGTDYLTSAHGRIIRFATCDAARRRAFALNGKPAPTPLGV